MKLMLNKKCSKCNEIKPVGEFSPRKDRAIGVQSRCKQCISKQRSTKWKNDQCHRDKQLKYWKTYVAKNKENISETRKIYNANPENKARRVKQIAERKKTDIDFKLKSLLRTRVRSALKQQGTNKSKKTMELIGCSMNFFRAYIETQFDNRMTWENQGRFGWHIDHIKPCAIFDLIDVQQQEECFHFTNLQPLWWNENLEKSSNYNGKHYGNNS